MVVFNETNHTYTDSESGRELISTTQLLAKHGLSPDYSKVNSKLLQAKANIGTMIHREIDEYFKYGINGISDEFNAFIETAKEQNLAYISSEQIVANDLIAGTFDLLATINGDKTLCDLKTTSVIHKTSVEWQCSIYVYLLDKAHYKDYKIGVYHLHNGKCEFKKLTKIALSNIERLFECEKNGITYTKQELLSIEETNLLLQQENEIVELQSYIDSLNKVKEQYYEKLLSAVRDSGGKHFELCNGLMEVSYIAPHTKLSVDVKRLQEEMPEIYNKYLKLSNVKDSIKVKINN